MKLNFIIKSFIWSNMVSSYIDIYWNFIEKWNVWKVFMFENFLLLGWYSCGNNFLLIMIRGARNFPNLSVDPGFCCRASSEEQRDFYASLLKIIICSPTLNTGLTSVRISSGFSNKNHLRKSGSLVTTLLRNYQVIYDLIMRKLVYSVHKLIVQNVPDC